MEGNGRRRPACVVRCGGFGAAVDHTHRSIDSVDSTSAHTIKAATMYACVWLLVCALAFGFSAPCPLQGKQQPPLGRGLLADFSVADGGRLPLIHRHTATQFRSRTTPARLTNPSPNQREPIPNHSIKQVMAPSGGRSVDAPPQKRARRRDDARASNPPPARTQRQQKCGLLPPAGLLHTAVWKVP